MSSSEPFQRGLKAITQIDPQDGPLFIEELKKVSPDFADYFVEFAFGTIHARSTLDPKLKELIAIANLLAIGHSQSHLKLRIAGAARLGCTREEVIEVIIQSVVLVGFVQGISALKLVSEIYG